MVTFSIRVVDEDGDPVEGVSVFIDFGWWYGCSEEHTDKDGWSEFDNLNEKLTYGEIFIAGESQGKYSTYDDKTHSFTLVSD